MSTDRKPKVLGRIGPAHSRLLAREAILAMDRPEGYRAVVAEFLSDVRTGRIPRTASVDRIAEAFQRLLRRDLRSTELDAALGLRERRGRRSGMTFRKLWEAAEGPIPRFIQSRVQADPKPRGARGRAIEAAATHFRKDVRTIEREWKRVQPALEALRSMDQLADQIDRQHGDLMRESRRLAHELAEQVERYGALVRQHLSNEELRSYGWPEAVELARARAARNTGAQIVRFPRR